VDRAFAGYLPRLDLDADIGPEIIDSPARRATAGDASHETRKVATLTATQNLFDGMATPAAVKIARLGVRVAEFTLAGTRQGTLLEGVDAYMEVLRQRRLIELSRSNERTIMLQLDLEDERVQRGAGIAVDVLQAKSRLQIAKERRVTFEGALEDAVTRYTQVFDRAPEVATMADPAAPLDLIPSTLDEAVAVALRENPAIVSSETTVEVAGERRRSARADYFPTLDLVGTYNFEDDRDAVVGIRREYSLLLQATWNLFNGFATQASVAQAALDYRASQDNDELVRRRVVEATRLAWQQLVTSRKRVELLENAVNIASEVFESRKRLREAGKETVINVLDAENEINNAQINFTAASYDAQLAAFRLLQAMGRLDLKELGIDDAAAGGMDSAPEPGDQSGVTLPTSVSATPN